MTLWCRCLLFFGLNLAETFTLSGLMFTSGLCGLSAFVWRDLSLQRRQKNVTLGLVQRRDRDSALVVWLGLMLVNSFNSLYSQGPAANAGVEQHYIALLRGAFVSVLTASQSGASWTTSGVENTWLNTSFGNGRVKWHETFKLTNPGDENIFQKTPHGAVAMRVAAARLSRHFLASKHLLPLP